VPGLIPDKGNLVCACLLSRSENNLTKLIPYAKPYVRLLTLNCLNLHAGDARLSKGVKNKVYSLDLVACDETVIACNMAKVSLRGI